MIDYLTYIATAAALLIGFLAGCLYNRRGDSEWRDAIIGAYQMGLDRGAREKGK